MCLGKLSVYDVKEGMILTEAVLSKDGALTLAGQHTVLTAAMIKRLIDHRVSQVRVAGEDGQRQVIVPKAEPVITNELRDEALGNLEDIFSLAKQSESEHHMTTAVQVVKQLDTVVDQLVESVTKEKKALVNIAELKSYDEYTYHHSLSVAVLAIAIAQNLGFSQPQMNLVGRCAMMHDIGKTAIPVEIINKPSRLDAREFSLVKQHSAEGYQYLMKEKIGDPNFWRAVLCHHEKYDGTGYPLGLKGRDIPLMSRIISVADVYDALTSYRSYRSPMQPAEAVELLMGEIGTAFDYDVVTALLGKLELYPVGSIIELSDNRLAAVIDNANAMRPIIQLLDTGATLDLFNDRSCLSLTVRRALEGPLLAASSA